MRFVLNYERWKWIEKNVPAFAKCRIHEFVPFLDKPSCNVSLVGRRREMAGRPNPAREAEHAHQLSDCRCSLSEHRQLVDRPKDDGRCTRIYGVIRQNKRERRPDVMGLIKRAARIEAHDAEPSGRGTLIF